MELDIKEFGATVAIGAYFLLSAHFMLMFVFAENIPQRLKDGLDLRESVVWLLLLVATFSVGILGETLSHEVVHGNGRVMDWFLKSENSMRARALYDPKSCCHSVEPLGQEVADDQLLEEFGGKNGPEVEAAIEAGAPFEPLQSTRAAKKVAMEAADTLYYAAKDRVYLEDNYYTEMQDIDTKIDFARSLAVFSILLMIATAVLAVGYLLFQGYRTYNVPNSPPFRPLAAMVVRRTIGCLLLFTIPAFAGKFAYEAEARQFNQRVFGYFASIREIDSKVARPRNIGELKNALRNYKEKYYYKDLGDAIKRATVFLPSKCAPDEAVVLDIDETALSNWEEIDADDFGYNTQRFNSYVERGRSPAIPSTLALYRQALKSGCKIFFITSRAESQRTVTENNLKEQCYSTWQKLIMKQDNAPSESAAEFKTRERRKLEMDGLKIILNVGDQESDLAGGSAEHRVLLPNPFYVIR